MVASRKDKILIGALLAGLALLVALIFHARSGIRQIDEQLARQTNSIQLANRTVELRDASFPRVFAQHQVPSARGTLPYLVVCAEPATKAARERVASCGARVLCTVSSRALLVETDEAALARIAAAPAFSAACELTAADKVSAELASVEGGVDITLIPLADADIPAVSNAVVVAGGTVLWSPVGRVRAHLPAAKVATLAVRGDVRWIERFTPARLLDDGHSPVPAAVYLRKMGWKHRFGQIVNI